MADLDQDKVRRDMALLAALVRELRDMYPRMELGQLHILLLVIARPNVNMADLMAPTQLTRAAISRNAQALSKISYLDGPEGDRREGLGLLAHSPDPHNARAKLVSPTEKGLKLAARLSAILRGRAPIWLD